MTYNDSTNNQFPMMRVCKNCQVLTTWLCDRGSCMCCHNLNACHTKEADGQ